MNSSDEQGFLLERSAMTVKHVDQRRDVRRHGKSAERRPYVDLVGQERGLAERPQ